MFDFLNGPVRDLVTQIYDAVGYLGVALWVAIESVIIPIPSEIVLPFAGFLVGEGVAVEPITGAAWSYWLVVFAGTVGATVGALVAYGIGAWGGRPLIERWGRFIGVSAADLDRAEGFFERHGSAASFFGRMLPVVRSLVSFAAGIARMPIGRFTLFTFLGSLPWTAALVYAGVALGSNWETIGGWLKRFEYAVLAVLVAIVLAWIWFRIVKPRRTGRPAAPMNEIAMEVKALDRRLHGTRYPPSHPAGSDIGMVNGVDLAQTDGDVGWLIHQYLDHGGLSPADVARVPHILQPLREALSGLDGEAREYFGLEERIVALIAAEHGLEPPQVQSVSNSPES